MVALLFFLVVCFFLPGHSGAAQAPQEQTLPPTVVTATRIETPLSQVTTSVSVITDQNMQDQHAETVIEALRNVPGVNIVESGARGTSTSIFIRGSNSDQVLVMVDGVEVNSVTLGQFNFAHLTTDNVERVEVLRGTGGTLWGSQAIGGVINIITKKGTGPAELTLSAEGGNWETNHQAVALRGSLDKLGYSFTFSHMGTDGFHRRFPGGAEKSNDDYVNLSSSARLDYRFTDDTNLTGIFHFIGTKLGLFNSNNFIAPNPGDPNAHENAHQYVAKLEWNQKILPAWDYRISGSFFKENISDLDSPEAGSFDATDRSRFRPQIATAEFQTNYRLGEWSTSTFGIEFKRRKASTSSSSDGFDLGGIERAIRNMGYYFENQLRFFEDRLILVPGVRLDDNQSFGTEWSPSFSAAYLFKEIGTKLKSGYTEGFKAPSLNELFFPSSFPGCPSFGNPNLGPEKSWELNAGFEQKLLNDRIFVEGTYFHREVRNLISFAPVAQGGCPFVPFQAANLGTARFDGVEWALKLQIYNGLSLNANYTYLDWDTADGRLLRRPRNTGNIVLNYVYDRWQANFITNIVGRRDDNDSATAAPIVKPSYVKFDLFSSYKLPFEVPFVKSSQIFGKIENLFNRNYQEADGFRAPPFNFLIGLSGTFGLTP